MKFFINLKETFQYWQRNQAARLSAALTYYTLASFAPMAVLMLSLAGLFFNPERVAQMLTGPIAVAIGSENAFFLRTILENAYDPIDNITTGLLSLIVVAITASGLIQQLSQSLNSFLQLPEEPVERFHFEQEWLRSLAVFVFRKLRAVAIVISVGVLLIGNMVLTTAVQVAEKWLGNLVELPYALYFVGNTLFSLLAVVAIFSLIYRYVPRKRFAWKPILSGALGAGILFILLQYLMGLYIGSSELGSTFGAAASLVVLLFWFYYSIQVMFLGAAWARTRTQNDSNLSLSDRT